MDILASTRQAFALLFSGDAELWTIIWISLRVSLTALALATPPAVILGYALAQKRFFGRRILVVLIQGLLSFPTVVVGLILYILLTRQGPLGSWQLLFTQEAMIMGQAVIAFPVLAAFALAAVQGADPRAHETAVSLGASPLRAALTTLLEVRFAVVAGVFNGFGRVISEVGCAMMVGGNIAGVTRNIPTAIALETSKGDFAQGIALGVVLMLFALGISITLGLLQGRGGLK
ncbi:MAG: ABC transporter permease [Betaproteobacteria bacterium RIFCSPLOWO2_12_FULL_64_23]|nr:MAG: ABC transporter permease [Betaproteobacteria bacterium RIFCSPLOWO2_12_FULL_64_23]